MTRAYHRPTALVPGSKEAECAKVLRRMKARRNQALGANGQAVVAARMIAMGFLCVEMIATPMAKVGGKYLYAARVSGDLRAVLPGGRAVLCESKARPDVLSLSDFPDHQWNALARHYDAGVFVIVGWYHEPDVFLLPWLTLDQEMTAGHPLRAERASEITLRGLP